ncbi:MAG TPA: hypothetical protein VMU24_02350 [Candidatus Acidoferrales bacterium]|nr:hypothetical protein [Candidatus Acidoferrales bacterium]
MKQRFVLEHTITGEMGVIDWMTRVERNERNQKLLKGNSPWRWMPYMPEAA